MSASHPASTRCTAFAGDRLIAAGPLEHVALAARQVRDAEPGARILIFEDATQRQVEVDLRGSMAALVRQLKAPPQGGAGDAPAPGATAADTEAGTAPRGRGRPRLGVVAREVTLLPRHWEWLAAQPGGASVALRRLVEQARRDPAGTDRRRLAQEAAYRFMQAIAGDAPGFEEATRALFAGDLARFEEQVAAWPQDVREHAVLLAGRACAAE